MTVMHRLGPMWMNNAGGAFALPESVSSVVRAALLLCAKDAIRLGEVVAYVVHNRQSTAQTPTPNLQRFQKMIVKTVVEKVNFGSGPWRTCPFVCSGGIINAHLLTTIMCKPAFP